MERATADEMRDTIAAFVDVDESPPLTLLDRSRLERYATCPRQARFIDSGAVLDQSREAASGDAVHAALSALVSAYVSSRGALGPTDLIGEAEQAVLSSRPDIQPDAIRGCRASLWAIAKFVAARHPENVLRWDGGDGDRSGQLAWDMPDLGVRVTSELDLLHAGPAPQLLHEVDWKSGHKVFSAQDVRDSFQFQLHAWLVFQNYPEVAALQTVIWHTRANRRGWAVEFRREDSRAIQARIRHAAGLWWTHRSDAPADTPAWPLPEKCDDCPAARNCAVVQALGLRPVADDPGGYVDRLVSLEAAVAQMRKAATAFVKMKRADIVSAAGNCYGANKPKSARTPKMATYREKPEGDEPNESEDDDGRED